MIERPRACRYADRMRSAARTFAGVIGAVRTRTPVAS
jgi:hypothetical protein